ncbi:MAG TPA: hypothetical protein VGG39_04020 [Polyangiaceae bacterium]
MVKARGEQYPASESGMRTRRRPDAMAVDPNEAFVRAFADALRDILRAEIRLSA